MSAVEIPLSPSPQSFSIALAGVTYRFTIKWNTSSNCWVLDIADDQNDPLVNGLAMVTGRDLLEPYGYLNFGGQLIVQTDNDPTAVPTFTNLGITSHLYFVQ